MLQFRTESDLITVSICKKKKKKDYSTLLFKESPNISPVVLMTPN